MTTSTPSVDDKTVATEVDGVQIAGDPRPDVLTTPALEWLAELQRTFGQERNALLARRAERRAERQAERETEDEGESDHWADER